MKNKERNLLRAYHGRFALPVEYQGLIWEYFRKFLNIHTSLCLKIWHYHTLLHNIS